MRKIVLLLSFCMLALIGQAANDEVLHIDFEKGLPAGWTQEFVRLPIDGTTDASLYSWHTETGANLQHPQGAVSGNTRLVARNSKQQEMRFVTRFVSPVINLQDVFQPQLTFSHAEPQKNGYCDTLRVYYRTAANDYWHLFPRATFQRNAIWKQETLQLISANSTYQIAFEITENMGYGVVLDDIAIHATPICQDVKNLQVSDRHAHDVLLGWDVAGAYDHFEVLLTSAPVADFNNIDPAIVLQRITENVFNPEIRLTSLQPEQTFYVYVRSVCDGNNSEFTSWVGTTFETLTTIQLPYFEDFNESVSFLGTKHYGRLPGWTIGSSDNLQIPFIYRTGTRAEQASFSIDSTAYLSFAGIQSKDNPPVEAGKYVYAATPEILLPALWGIHISFWVTACDRISLGTSRYAAELLVGVMTDPTDFNTFTPVDTVRVETAYMFKRAEITLKDYFGEGKYIAFVSKAQEANAIYMDNLSITNPPVATPTHVRCHHVSSQGFTVSAQLRTPDAWNLRIATSYQRDGKVPAADIVFEKKNIQTPSFSLTPDEGTWAGKTLLVYTQAVKNGRASAWSFPVTLRVPTAMSPITDTKPYRESFEPAVGEIRLTSLAHELRLPGQPLGASTVFYPVTSINPSFSAYPRITSVAPNAIGSHVQLCGSDTWFVLPETMDNLKNLKMTFSHATNSSSSIGQLSIGVMDDPYDISTFTPLASFCAQSTAYNRCLVSFDAYNGKGKFIAFRSMPTDQEEISINLIDEIEVSLLSDCREASNIDVRVHARDVDIAWNAGGMKGWKIGLAKTRSMAKAIYQVVSSPNVTFHDLRPQTTYYYTIQTICGVDTMPTNGITYSFTTPQGLPIKETFIYSDLPEGWRCAYGAAKDVFNGAPLEERESSDAWQISSKSDYIFPPMSGYVARAYITGKDYYYWLISPTWYVDAQEDETIELTFDVAVKEGPKEQPNEAGVDDKFIVVISEDAGKTWRVANATVWSNDGYGHYSLNSDLRWHEAQNISIDMTRYVGKTIQVAFYAESSVDNAKTAISIDNIALQVRDARCGGLSRLRADANTSNSATITWFLNGINPKPAIIQVSRDSDFMSMFISDTISGNNLKIDQLKTATIYYVRGRQACQNDLEWKVVSFCTQCEAVNPDTYKETFSDGESVLCWNTGFWHDLGQGMPPQRISSDRYGSVLEISKPSTASTASDGAYAISPKLMVADTINTYQLVFDACTYSTAADNIHRLAVGVVSDPADPGYTFMPIEEVALPYAADSTSMRTFVVSLENYDGDINGDFGQYIMFLSEAGSDSTNYVYIDNVFIEPIQRCQQVIDLEVDSTFVDGAVLHWTGNASQYEIIVLPAPVLPDTVESPVYTSAKTTFSITGLQPATQYYMYVRGVCNDGMKSRWSSATVFTTTYGVPYLEPFAANSFADGIWETARAFWEDDSIKRAEMKFSKEWNLSRLSLTGLQGIESYYMQLKEQSDAWLISPRIDMTKLNQVVVTLSASVALSKKSSTTAELPLPSDRARLGVCISTDDGNTWRKSDAVFWACDSTGVHNYNQFGPKAKKISMDVTPYVGKSIRIAFYHESLKANNMMFLDSVQLTWREAVCLGVKDLQFVPTSDTTAHVSWRVYGAPDEVNVELSEYADFSEMISTISTTQSSCDFDQLITGKTYYVRVTQEGCTSSVTRSVLMPYIAPYTETFSGDALPAMWSTMTGSVLSAFAGTLPTPNSDYSTEGWKIMTTPNGLPANHLVGELSNATSKCVDQWIVSPEVGIKAIDKDMVLSFDLALTAHNSKYAATDTHQQELRVLVSTDDGASWNSNSQWLFADTVGAYRRLSSLSATGERIELSMSQYAGKRVRIAFYKTATRQDNSCDVHIANVRIAQPCANPDSLSASNIGFTQANLSWKGTTGNPTIIEYATTDDFLKSKLDTIASGLTHTLSALQEGTAYYVRVYQICAGNQSSDFSNTLSFTTTYGVPYVEAFTTLHDWKTYNQPVSSPITDTPKDSVSTSKWKTVNDTTVLGVPHIYCTYSTKERYWLVSPIIDLTRNTIDDNVTLQLTLALTTSSTSTNKPRETNSRLNEFNILVSTDEGATWTEENRWIWSNVTNAYAKYVDIPTTGGLYSIDFSHFAGKRIRIALVHNAPKSMCLHVSNLYLSAGGSTCFGVQKIEINHVDTAASLTLTPADRATQWEIAYGTDSLSPSDMPRCVVDTKEFTLEGLSLGTPYCIYARSICAEGDTSAWSEPYPLQTPQGVPYQATFDSTFCDWQRFIGDPKAVFEGSKKIVPADSKNQGWKMCDGKYAFGHNHLCCSSNAQTAYWLVSPLINLMPQNGDKEIYFGIDLALTKAINSSDLPAKMQRNTFYVAVSTDEGTTWREEECIIWGEDTQSADYLYAGIPNGRGRRYYLNFTKYAGKTIRIALIEGNGGSNTYNFGSSTIHVNNVELEEYVRQCFGAADVQFAIDGTFIQCTIVPNDTASAWQYAYGESGVDIASAKICDTNSKSFVVSGLRMNTGYDMYVRSVYAERDTSVWTGPYSFQTDNGVPYYHSLIFDDDFLSPEWSRWVGNRFGELIRPTSNSGWCVFNTANGVFGVPHTYIDLANRDTFQCYILATPQLYLQNLSSESIELSFDLALTANRNDLTAPTFDKIIGQQFKILVSADGGKTWEAAAVWNETGKADYSYAAIPATGQRYFVDLTRFANQKVYVGFYAEYAGETSGGSSTLHIRNMLIDTLSSDGCEPIESMVVKEATYHTATVEFHSPSIKTAAGVEYVCLPANSHFSATTAQRINTNIVKLSGLQFGMDYDVYARMQCANGTWTEWTGPYGFSTTDCHTVKGVEAQEVTLHHATLVLDAWDTDRTSQYQVYIAEENGALLPEQAITSATNTLTFSKEMTASSWYDVYARKICQSGDTSEWAGPFGIRTPYSVPYIETTHWAENEIDSTWTRYQGALNKLRLQASRTDGWCVGKAGWVFPKNHLYVSTEKDTSLLVSPLIDLSNIAQGTPVTLTFDMALTNMDGANVGVNPAPKDYTDRSFSVLVSTDNVWTERNGWTWSEKRGKYKYSSISVDGDTYELDLSAYAGKVFRIGFYSGVEALSWVKNIIHLQNIRLDTVEIASCKGVGSVVVSDITSSNAQVSFRYKGLDDVEMAKIEVATDPLFENIVVLDTIRNTNTYLLHNLQPATTYYLHLRHICDGGGVLPWTHTTTFTTTYALRYQEDFGNITEFERNWSVYRCQAAKVFSGEETFDSKNLGGKWCIDSVHYVSFNDNFLKAGLSNNDYSWVVSPSIDLTQEAGNVLLSFEAALAAGETLGPKPEQADMKTEQRFMVVISDDNGASWKRENTTVWSNIPTDNADYPLSALEIQPTRFLVDMSKYIGNMVRVAFYAEAVGNGKYNHYMVDNIDINRTIFTTYTDTICQGDDYGAHGLEYAAENLRVGENRFQLINNDMSEVTDLTIVVNPIYTTRYTGTVCEGERFSGYGFDVVGQTSTTYRRFVANENKCDSIYLLDLSVIPTRHVEVFDSICAGGQFVLNGQIYRYNSIAYDTLSSQVSGCDSITMHYIIFTEEKTLHTDITRAICQGEWYSDGWFTQNKAGYYRKTDTSAQGCDSTVTLHLFVADESGYIYDSVYMNQLPYIYDGRVLLEENTADGYYEFPVESAAGICTITLRVRVMLPTGIEQTSAESITIAPNPVRVGEPIHILTATDLSAEFEAAMYNATGQLVYHIGQPTNTLPALPTAGIYTLRLHTRQGTYQTKLLVQ